MEMTFAVPSYGLDSTVPKALPSPDVETTQREELAPLFNVVLLNDDEHTYDYVIEMLQKIFLISKTKAFQHTVEVDTSGRTVVLTCELPQAEYARDQIQLYGKDWRLPKSQGSMSAVIEPATGEEALTE